MGRKIVDRIHLMENEIYQVPPWRMPLEMDFCPTSVVIHNMGQLIFTRTITRRLSMASEEVELVFKTRSDHPLRVANGIAVSGKIVK